MVVSVPLYTHLFKEKMPPEVLWEKLRAFYTDSTFIKVMEFGAEKDENEFFAANAYAGRDDAQIYVTGNEDRILLTARFDNLGKGASGAAIQCMNIRLGIDETTGLNLN